MSRNDRYAIFYLSQMKSISLLKKLVQSHFAVSQDALETELRDVFESRAQLLKFLRRGEMLGFIEREKRTDGSFQYAVTSKGQLTLKKYMELLKVLRSRKERIAKTI